MGTAKAFRIRKLGSIFENRHVKIEQQRLSRDGLRDVSPACDDQPRLAGNRLEQQIVRLTNGHQSSGTVRQLFERSGGRAGIELG